MGMLMDGPLHVYQFVCISILCTACCSSLPERFLEGPRLSLKMESYNFQHILSWQTGSDPKVPTNYSVLYTSHSYLKTAKQCSHIAHLFCNLTDDFEDESIEYSAFVQSFVGTEVFHSSGLRFVPLTDTFLGPPEVNISSCPLCINITVKLPTTHLRKNGKLQSLVDIYGSINYDIMLKTPDGEQKRPSEITTEETFNTVIEELYPNRNYCVSVMVTASLNKHSVPSVWKCVTTDSVAQQDYRTFTILSAVFVSMMLAVVLKCMHAAGYIRQKILLPDTLAFIRTFTYLPCTFEPEKIVSVEVIYKEVKKKAEESSGDVSDEDEDDSESDAMSGHDYARRDLICRASHSSDVPNGLVQHSTGSTCDDSSSQVSENPDDDPEVFGENKMDIAEDKDTASELLNPLSKVNCTYSPPSRNNACFTINLKSVLLGISEETTDSSTALLSSQEDAVDWQCTHAVESKLLDDTESVQKPHCLNSSDAWQDSSSSSSESDTSDSDVDLKTEYLRR